MSPDKHNPVAKRAQQSTQETLKVADDVLSGTSKKGWLARILPFMAPAFIASVAYVDSGNFATNIAGGAKFGYTLLWVIVLSNLMAMLIQRLSAKLGIATGHNLAEHCRMRFPKWVVRLMWGLQDAPQAIHGDRHLTNEEEACRYLEQIATARFQPDRVQSHVHTEKVQDVARSIVDHTGELAPDLIVMRVHGEGGLHDFVLGSIAQQVIGRGKTSILLLNPDQTLQPCAFGKILVVLDDNPAHAGALAVAAELAQKVGATLH